MRVHIGTDRLAVEINEGGSVVTGPRPPKIDGWMCRFVCRSPERTVFHYTREQ